METKQVVTNTNPVLPVKPPKDNDSNLTFTIVITFILGILSIASLLVLLKVRKGEFPAMQNETTVMEKTEAEKVEEAAEVVEDDELGRKKFLRELDEVDFEGMAETYSEEEFDQL